ncbi:hypothetical protein DLJ49_08785 [Rhodovulum sp. 12E13]|uniref:GvpL/GvpF family gas vesicle protein n=1 Tax=Rhodovulum sp. 12E13 TaxID=2203891 RepID=UPI000E1455F1|nr:GvpL/GvpF family gas vesicle protein [Rhodovulum sp. 12E13]RDC73191.1 hypothetical protein DLJ49_08785 [Rhodovulum sp. 12E13]
MTALILHGLTDAATPAPVDAAPHLRVRAGGLVALCTPLEAMPQTEEEAVSGALAHNALLVAQARLGDVLPVRFPAGFSGEAALHTHLAAEGARYRAGLARIGGAHEYGLRLALRPGAALPAGARDAADGKEAGTPANSGRAFLERGRRRRDLRAERAAARVRMAERLATEAAGLAREAMPGAPRTDRLVDLALLVPASGVDALRACAAAGAREAAGLGLDLALSGPWPPYSFAGHGEAAHG